MQWLQIHRAALGEVRQGNFAERVVDDAVDDLPGLTHGTRSLVLTDPDRDCTLCDRDRAFQNCNHLCDGDFAGVGAQVVSPLRAAVRFKESFARQGFQDLAHDRQGKVYIVGQLSGGVEEIIAASFTTASLAAGHVGENQDPVISDFAQSKH